MPVRSALRLLAAAAALLAAGCATAPPGADGWHDVRLPGKTPTQYEWTAKDGRPALRASADASASMWRRKLHLAPEQIDIIEFSWWVEDLIAEASVADADREDAPARVLVAFDGDHGRLAPRTRVMFELAQTLTGERPPYATLMYVFEREAPPESLIVNPRSDRIRKIVVDSGEAPLRRWRQHRRDLVADYRRAFGEDPGPVLAVAVMTDSDNTRSRARAWYGPVELRGR